MDIKLMDAAPTRTERAAVDELLEDLEGRATSDDTGTRVGSGGHDYARQRRHLLLPALHAVQKRIGWISKGALNHVCERLTVPPAEAYGVASFYAMFTTHYRPPKVAHVCDDIACKLAGAEGLLAELETKLGPAGSAVDSNNGDGGGTWLRSPCLGQCERAPAVFFQITGREEDGVIAPASAEDVARVLSGGPIPSRSGVSAPQTQDGDRGSLRLLRRVGAADPESLSDYQAQGGYQALRHAIALGPEPTIREMIDSGLRGRGGAAFPMGRKWEAVAQNPVRPHYVVANADESEPATFKDRILMEEDPFALVEAMTIAGFAVAAEVGYLYIRGEYPLATARLRHAIDKARAAGLLGDDVMGRGFRFDIELCRGAGAYICGEETALFNSIEGFRGEPRTKPPFPTQVGLFGKPTVVNNVETLVNVIDIMMEGGPAFAGVGTRESTGPKLFCVSGSVTRPGLYELPFGATLRQLIDLAGGVPEGRRLRAILLGGAAGSFISPENLDVALTFEGTRAIGASLGSGVVMAFDDQTDFAEIVMRIAAFFRDESCGQCVPCRVGTARQEEALHRLLTRQESGSRDAELQLLRELSEVMKDASICGLGQTAASAVQSALELGLFSERGSSG
jgi:NADH-quinone oxidoreductase subunit F